MQERCKDYVVTRVHPPHSPPRHSIAHRAILHIIILAPNIHQPTAYTRIRMFWQITKAQPRLRRTTKLRYNIIRLNL